MNGNYYQNPTFPNNPNNNMNNQGYQMPPSNNEKLIPEIEISYIENILRANKGKAVKVYYSYPDSEKWRDVEYYGTIEEAGIDHLIIRDGATGVYYLLRMIYLNYIDFMEPINYQNNNL